MAERRRRRLNPVAGRGQPVMVSVRCKFDLLREVEARLGRDNLQRIRKSCFGHLFDVPPMQFQGQLYHVLVRNHLIPDMENRLCFNFNGTVFEFGPVDFALITGLKFSGNVEPPQSSVTHSLLFTNRLSMKFRDIEAAFLKECKKSAGTSLLSLKLAFLYVLYAVVLPRDRKDKTIEMQYIHLIDDLKSFENFPWGRVSYDYLVSATHSRRGVIDNLIRQEKKMAYDAFGFVLALQTWAYETMPDLGRDCAYVVKRNLKKFPRILHWRADEFFHREFVMAYFAPQFDDRRRIMTPSSEEWERLQRLGLQERHMSPPKAYVKPPSKRKAGDLASGVERKKKKVSGGGMKDRLRSSKGKEKIDLVDSSAESKRKETVLEKNTAGQAEEVVSNVTLQEVDAQLKEHGRQLAVIQSLLRRCKCFSNDDTEKGGLDVGAGAGVVSNEEGHAVGSDEKEEGREEAVGGIDDEEMVDIDISFLNSIVEEVFLNPTVDVVEEKVEEDVGGSELALGLRSDEIVTPVEDVGGIDGEEMVDIDIAFVNSVVEEVFLNPTVDVVEEKDEEDVGGSELALGLSSDEIVTPGASFPSVDEDEDGGCSKSLLEATPKSPRSSGTKSVQRQLFGSKSKKYDPFDSAYKHRQAKPFETWHRAAVTMEPEPETPLPIISNSRVKASWFKAIWERDAWLADEHIDALLNLLIFKYKRANDGFLTGWGVVDALATGMLMKGDFDNSATSLYNYISGKLPRECGLPWVELRQVMGVANVNKNHWVCYVIDFESQSVSILDSMRGERSWTKIAKQFDHMIRYLPWLCRHFHIWEQKKMSSELQEVWTLKSNKEVPQQGNGYDCGIMAVKYLECLASGQPLSSIHPGRCGIFRRSYCAQLFELGREHPAPK